MPYPSNIVLVRHGLSEANIVRKGLVTPPEGFLRAADAKRRLTAQGIQEAEITGQWLRNQKYTFSRHYVSPFFRTMETAINLNLSDNWIIDDLWRERDWGEYGLYSDEEQERRFEDSTTLRESFSWYWNPVGGESLATDVRSRVNSLLTHLSRREDESPVIAVSHEETIGAFQFVVERLTSHQWIEREKDPYYKLHNASIVEYTRINPEKSSDVREFYRWGRVVNPNHPELSQNNGEWYYIPRKHYSMKEMTEIINTSKPWF